MDRRDDSGPTELEHEDCADQEETIEGAFLGLQAAVLRLFPARKSVKIRIDLLSRKTEAEIDRTRVLRKLAQLSAA